MIIVDGPVNLRFPTYIERQLDLAAATAQKSCFLFGPRQTGKSMLIRETLPTETPIYNLLDPRVLLDLSADPTRMGQELEARGLLNALVVVDEIQKLPGLLEEIHLLIETRGGGFCGPVPQPGACAVRVGISWVDGPARATSTLCHAIEVKATSSIASRDLRGLKALSEEGLVKNLILVCQEATPRQIGTILVLPWQEFLGRLWSDLYLE